VDLAQYLGARKLQQLVVALQVLGMVLEAFAAEIGLAELVALDHGAHRTVDDDDAPRQQRGQFEGSGVGGGGAGHGCTPGRSKGTHVPLGGRQRSEFGGNMRTL